MRISWLLSISLHALVALAVTMGGLGSEQRIDLTQQVYTVDIVGDPTLPLGPKGDPDLPEDAGDPGGGPKARPAEIEEVAPPAPEPEPAPKPAPKEIAAAPEPEPKPEPPKPTPTPEAQPTEKGKAISAQKQPEPPKPEPKPEPPKPEVAEKKPEPPKQPEKKPEPPKPQTAQKPPAPKTPEKPRQPTQQELLASALQEMQREAAIEREEQQAVLDAELQALKSSYGGAGEGAGTGQGQGAAPRRSGGTGGGGGADPLSAYGKYIENTIKQFWSLPPIIDRSLRYSARLVVTVEPTGQITNVYVDQTSGRQDFDLSAIKAVDQTKRLGALEPPPVNNQLVLRIEFDSAEF